MLGFKRICKAHGTFEGRCGNLGKTTFVRVWFLEVRQLMGTGIHSFIGQIRRNCLVHGGDVLYPVHGRILSALLARKAHISLSGLHGAVTSIPPSTYKDWWISSLL